MKRFAWTLLALLVFLVYYLASIPGLKVLPVLRQINGALQGGDQPYRLGRRGCRPPPRAVQSP